YVHEAIYTFHRRTEFYDGTSGAARFMVRMLFSDQFFFNYRRKDLDLSPSLRPSEIPHTAARCESEDRSTIFYSYRASEDPKDPTFFDFTKLHGKTLEERAFADICSGISSHLGEGLEAWLQETPTGLFCLPQILGGRALGVIFTPSEYKENL